MARNLPRDRKKRSRQAIARSRSTIALRNGRLVVAGLRVGAGVILSNASVLSACAISREIAWPSMVVTIEQDQVGLCGKARSSRSCLTVSRMWLSWAFSDEPVAVARCLPRSRRDFASREHDPLGRRCFDTLHGSDIRQRPLSECVAAISEQSMFRAGSRRRGDDERLVRLLPCRAVFERTFLPLSCLPIAALPSPRQPPICSRGNRYERLFHVVAERLAVLARRRMACCARCMIGAARQNERIFIHTLPTPFIIRPLSSREPGS